MNAAVIDEKKQAKFGIFDDLTKFDPADFELSTWPHLDTLDPDAPPHVIEGELEHRGVVLYREPNGLYTVGIWECLKPVKFRMKYDGPEACRLLEGSARLTNEVTGKSIDLKKGDYFVVPAGTHVIWEVFDTAKKIYSIFESEASASRFY